MIPKNETFLKTREREMLQVDHHGCTFVGIPFYTLAKYRAMGDAVPNLGKAGVVQRIKSVDNDLVDLGDVDCPSIVRDHGPKNLRNFEEFSEGTRRVKDKLTGLVDPSRIAFCLGGDCAFVPRKSRRPQDSLRGKAG